MPGISPHPLPATALLRKYLDSGDYTDCYMTEVPAAVSQAAFVRAFYTTPLFKVERAILRFLVARPSTDADAAALASGSASSFAAWRVEARADDQLLLADFMGRTCSWLMTVPSQATDGGTGTRLYFGSAVVRILHAPTGERRMGFAFHALLGFHRLYSRLLLGAARRRVVQGI